MSLNIVKLCVGADSVDDLAAWQKAHYARRTPVCGTRMWPKRAEEVLAGGSLYWIVKGVIAARQRIIKIAPVRDEFGERCGLYLGREIVRTAPQPRRAFQGWRYLDAKDAPADLSATPGGENLPDDLRRQLVELGAW